jgi:hypothetical protein
MACHYPVPEAKAALDAALAEAGIKAVLGRNQETSEFGQPYKRQIAFAETYEELAAMAKVILARQVEAGAKAFIFREPPTINGYEEKRLHQFALVLNYHPLDKEPGV